MKFFSILLFSLACVSSFLFANSEYLMCYRSIPCGDAIKTAAVAVKGDLEENIMKSGRYFCQGINRNQAASLSSHHALSFGTIKTAKQALLDLAHQEKQKAQECKVNLLNNTNSH